MIPSTAMKTRLILLLATAFLASACGGSSPGRDLRDRWPPEDFDSPQLQGLGDSVWAAVPRCRSETPVLTPDSIGPLSPDQTLSAVLSECQDVLYGWDWGDEAIAGPAIAVRLGEVLVVADLRGTTDTSTVYRLFTDDSAARTVEGFGPGTLVADIRRFWGDGTLAEAECVLFASFPTHPGLVWRLAIGGEWECGSAEQPGRVTLDLLPAEAAVSRAIVYTRRD